MRLAYRILNVFTVSGQRLSGNPLCVFEDGSALSEEQMQALARQLNLSETTFLMPSTRATAHVRIFTPTFEMPFAGHPTLGTAHVVRAMKGGDSLTLEMIAGIVPVTAEGDRWTLRTARPVTSSAFKDTRADLARMIGLEESALAGEARWVNTGSEQLVIPLVSVAHVRAAQPDPALVQKFGLRPNSHEGMAYVWAREEGSADRIVVRFFFTQNGAVIEDPATGSACANLGGYFLETGAPVPLTVALSQGEAVSRPSHLGLCVDGNRQIFVTGSVVELGRGEMEL